MRAPPALPVNPRPSSRSARFKSSRETCAAGARPNSIAATREMPSVKSSAVIFNEIWLRRGTLTRSVFAINRTTHAANVTPTAPPKSAISALSVSNCRINRPRPAPSAARTAISFRRPAAREQQAGDVGAGDEQDQTHRADQYPQGFFHGADQVIVERQYADVVARIGDRPLRMILPQLREHRADLSEGLFRSHAWFQAGDRPQVVAAPVRIGR